MFAWLSTVSSAISLISAALKAAHSLENGWSKREKRLAVAAALNHMNTTKGDTSALDNLYNSSVPQS